MTAADRDGQDAEAEGGQATRRGRAEPGAGHAWRPVAGAADDARTDGDAEDPDEAQGAGDGGPGDGVAPARRPGRGDTASELLRREFMGAPEGVVREGGLVVRPSMRAALDRVLKAFLVITPFFIPLALETGLGAGDGDGGPENLWLLAVEVASNLIFPFIISLVPAVQLAFTRYILDDEGVHERVQLLSRSDKRVRWDKVTALQHRRTFFDRLLGIERVDIVAYGKRGTTLHLIGLREARYIRDMVARQMRGQASAAGMLRND